MGFGHAQGPDPPSSGETRVTSATQPFTNSSALSGRNGLRTAPQTMGWSCTALAPDSAVADPPDTVASATAGRPERPSATSAPSSSDRCSSSPRPIRQPFSYDELQQIAPYGSSDLGTITGATRQPPIDPLLGAFFHHLFGEGQLQDRLVPVLSGIASLIVMSLLLRRFGLRYAGAFAVLVLATAPLMIRYSAYTRPYALPMLLMIVTAYAITSWLTGRPATLAVARGDQQRAPPAHPGAGADRLPRRHRGDDVVVRPTRAADRRQYLPVTVITAAAVLTVGLTQYFSLAESANQYFSTRARRT